MILADGRLHFQTLRSARDKPPRTSPTRRPIWIILGAASTPSTPHVDDRRSASEEDGGMGIDQTATVRGHPRTIGQLFEHTPWDRVGDGTGTSPPPGRRRARPAADLLRLARAVALGRDQGLGHRDRHPATERAAGSPRRGGRVGALRLLILGRGVLRRLTSPIRGGAGHGTGIRSEHGWTIHATP